MFAPRLWDPVGPPGAHYFGGLTEEEIASVLEIAPVAGLLALCLVLTLAAGPVMRYLQDAASALHAPQTYIESVLSRP